MQLYGLNGLPETIAALKVQAAGYRIEAVKIAKRVNDYVNSANFQNNRSQGFVEEDGWASQSKSEWDRAIAAEDNKLRRWRAEALMLEQRAAVIEGSIISLTLQAQTNAAATVTPKPISTPVAVSSKPVPIVAAPSKPVPATVVSPVPPQVRVTAPGNVSKASIPQIPEAPLPVTLPPISKIQPVAVTPTMPGLPGAPGQAGAPGLPGVPGAPALSTDMKKLLPWILAAGAAFLF